MCHVMRLPLGFALLTLMTIGAEAATYLKIDSSADAYVLIRGDKPVDVQDGMYLKPGDHLEIKSATAHASLVSATGKLTALDIPPGGKSLSAAELGGDPSKEKFSQTWNWASDWLLQRVGVKPEETDNKRVVQAAARAVGGGEPLAVPLASQGGLRLIGGTKRPLNIAWSGGKGPFNVTLKSDNQTIRGEAHAIEGHHFAFETLMLNPGNYSFDVTDQVETVHVPLVVVARGDVPENENSASRNDQETLANSIKLATRQQGWAFEAYQQAIPLEPRLPFAKVFVDALESGDFPTP
ncbi:MAG: hypothetical protein RLZZ627_547 [Pseudomonadota bacterium]